jgi:hypothetical protein
MESDPKNKKRYSPPVLTELTPEQAKNLVVDRKNCNAEEAAEFLKSLRRKRNQEEQNKQSLNPPEDHKRKRSA